MSEQQARRSRRPEARSGLAAFASRDAVFEQWQRSFPFDVRLLPQEVAASKAHARMIAAAGILTDAELEEDHRRPRSGRGHFAELHAD